MDPMSGYSIPAELTEGFRRSLPRTIAWPSAAWWGTPPFPCRNWPCRRQLAPASGLVLTAWLLQLLGRRLRPPLLAVDWTEWTRQRRCLVAAAAVHSRWQ